MNNNFEKKLREYMKLPYTVMLKRDEQGDIIARVKELEGCVADGQDEMEALGNLESVKELWISAALKAGQEIPKPDDEEELPSGKWLTRVPRSLHRSLIELAQLEGVSLNQLVAVALAEAAGRKAAVPRRSEAPEQSVPSIHGLSDYLASRGARPPHVVYSSAPSTPSSSASQEAEVFMERLVINSLSMEQQKIPKISLITSRKRGEAVA